MGACEKVGLALDYLVLRGIDENTLVQMAELFRVDPKLEKLFFKELLESNLIGGNKE